MRDRSVLAFPLLLAAVASFFISLGRSPLDKPLPANPVIDSAVKQVDAPRIAAAFAELPLRFEANQGQTDSRVKFVARGSSYTLFLTPDSAVLTLQKPAHPAADSESKTSRAGAQSKEVTLDVVRMKLIHANADVQVEGRERLGGVSNYFVGNDPRAWRANVANFAKVRYRDVYPGVDLVYYGHGGELEYDFVVAPSADPRKIEFELGGIQGMRSDERGNLVMRADGGEVILRRPVIYQSRGGERREIAGRYAMRGADRAGFELGSYDRSLPLIIDPVLAYSSYIGGNGADLGMSVALDKSNNIYVTGSTQSNNFPNVNALTVALRGIQNVFVTKLNANGNTFTYSTYFGGTGTDQGNGIAADATGNAYITGYTNSKNFPLAGTPFQGQLNGIQNAFVSKFNANGGLTFSTYLGGNGTDVANGIALDSTGDAYVAGQTSSTNFPVAGAIQGTLGGITNGFISKVKPDGTGLVFSTYLGGSASDMASGIALDGNGNAYVTGQTTSANFPTAAPLQATLAGPANAFVSEIKSDGTALVFSTFLGGTGNDQGNGIAVDSAAVYVAGATTSKDFPLKTPLQSTLKGDQNGFVSKLAANGGSLAFSTYLGGSIGDRALGIAVNSTGTIYVTGQTRSNDFPTFHPFEAALDGPANVFVSAFKNDGSGFVYSTFLGGNGNDSGNSITVNSAGDAVLAGTTLSSNFPLAGPAQTFFAGASDVFVARVTPAAGPGVLLTPPAIVFPSTNINTSATPIPVVLTNTGDAALTITSLKIIGANTTAFTQANTCGNSVAAGANCTFTINFMPTVGGTLSATIQIFDNAVGSPQEITISGTGNAPTPTVALFPPTVLFTGTSVGQTSTPQPVTLTNNGTGPLTITSVQITGNNKDDFSQTNTCGTTVAAAASCTINVTFKPADAGNRQANLLVNDNATDTPQVAFLLGGESFAVNVNPPAAALTAGESISSTVTVTPGNGFNQAVTLTCTALPQGAKCTFLPASVTPDGTNPISAVLTLTTTVRSELPGPLGKWLRPWLVPRSPAQFAPWLALLAALVLLSTSKKRGQPRVRLGFAGVGMLFLFLAGCGGGSSSNAFKPGPTPAGTFNVMVTGTAGKLVQTATLQLFVN